MMSTGASPNADEIPRGPTERCGCALWPVLACVFFLALAVRLAYMWQVSGGPLFDVYQGDARWHAEWARRIASGTFTDGRPFFRAPLYPFFVAGAYRLLGESLLAVRVLQHVLGAASCALLFLLARRAFSQRVALIAALAAALYGPLMYFENDLLIPPLAVFLMLCMLLAAARAGQQPCSKWWLVTGVLLGLCGIVRPNFLLFLPVLTVWLLIALRSRVPPGRRAFHACVLIAATAVPIAPVTLHNMVIGGDVVLIASQWGVNFEIGNNPTSDGKTAAAPAWLAGASGRGYADNVYAASRRVAEADLDRRLKDSEVARYWFRRGLRFWRDEPAHAAGLFLKKLYYLVNGFEIESNRSMYLDRAWSSIFRVLVWVRGMAFPFGLVGPLALLGLFMGGGDRRVVGILRLFAAAYALSVVLFFVTGRFRIPLAPIACVFASHAVYQLAQMVASRRWRHIVVAAPAGLILVVLCNTAWFGVRSVDRAREAWVVGSAQMETGRLDEAVEHFERSLAVEPDNPRTLTDLGIALLRRGGEGDLTAAIRHFRRALEASPEYVQALLGQGRAIISRDGAGGYAEAAACFEQALRVAPHFSLAYVYLGDLLIRWGRADEATERLEAAVAAGTRGAAVRLTLGRAYEATGRPDRAAEEYAEALRLDPEDVLAHYRLGGLLLAAGDVGAAVGHLREATHLRPTLARAWYLLGNAVERSGDTDEAMRCYEQAVAREPGLSDAQNNLAALLARRGRIEEATAHLRRALEAAPDDPDVRTNLAALLRRQEHWREAITVLADGLDRTPQSPDIALDLAWMLATCPVDDLRDGPRAVELAERHAGDVRDADAHALDVLAAAYAEVGRFDDAAAAAERAAARAAAGGRPALAREIAARAAAYRRGQPYRDGS